MEALRGIVLYVVIVLAIGAVPLWLIVRRENRKNRNKGGQHAAYH